MNETKFTYIRTVTVNGNGTKRISLPAQFNAGDRVKVIYDAKYNEVIVRPLK
jgi:hypothetical protein